MHFFPVDEIKINFVEFSDRAALKRVRFPNEINYCVYMSFLLFVSAAFIRVVGSEFVQKYLGEGPRMVRDVFRLAKENAPAIIFIDEIDAIATKRFDAQTGGKYILCNDRFSCIGNKITTLLT